jgi:LysR family hydrogen peroxide-inducible transcriptional activator
MLFEYQTEPMLERLRHGEIDMGVLALPVEADGLVERALYDEPFVVALPEAHRLAARAHLRSEDLAGETVLLLEEGHCLRDQALAACRYSGMHEKQDFRATSIETLRQMVAAGVGVTLLPLLASRGAYDHTRGVAVRPFARPVPSRRIGAVWRKSSARATAIEAIADQITRHSGLG